MTLDIIQKYFESRDCPSFGVAVVKANKSTNAGKMPKLQHVDHNILVKTSA